MFITLNFKLDNIKILSKTILKWSPGQGRIHWIHIFFFSLFFMSILHPDVLHIFKWIKSKVCWMHLLVVTSKKCGNNFKQWRRIWFVAFSETRNRTVTILWNLVCLLMPRKHTFGGVRVRLMLFDVTMEFSKFLYFF